MTGPVGRRPDASMTLINEMFERPLDPGYAAEAARRTRLGLPRARIATVPAFLAAVVIGFVSVTAALALRPAPTAAASVKADLVRRIADQRTAIDRAERSATDLQAQILDLEDTPATSDLGLRIEAATRAVGLTALQGPGLEVVLTDAADTTSGSGLDPRSSSGFPNGRVTSADLQVVTNGLWSLGAEAISINGHRLTSRSAIRFAGQALLVDFRPLIPPYTVVAIGDPATLGERLQSSPTGAYLDKLTTAYRIPVRVETKAEVTVPAGNVLDPVLARPLPSEATR